MECPQYSHVGPGGLGTGRPPLLRLLPNSYSGLRSIAHEHDAVHTRSRPYPSGLQGLSEHQSLSPSAASTVPNSPFSFSIADCFVRVSEWR